MARVDARSIAADRIKDGTVYVGLESIDSFGNVDEAVVVAAGRLKSSKFIFDARHILYGKLRPNLAKVARPSQRGVCSTDIYPILPGPNVDRGYLAQFLHSRTTVAKSTSLAVGINLPRISWRSLAGFDFPLVSLREQRRVANVLDEVDGLMRARRRAIELLRSTTLSVVTSFFADPRWKDCALGEVVTAIESGFSPITLDREPRQDEWGILKLGAVTSGVFNPVRNLKALRGGDEPNLKYAVRYGDLLMSRKNTLEHVGASVFVDSKVERMLIPDLIFRLVTRDDVYLSRTLQSQLALPSIRTKLQASASGSAASMSNISKERLMRILVKVPPLSDQRKLEGWLEAIAQQSALMDAQLDRLSSLKLSLEAKFFGDGIVHG
ncbi:hypothetical protein HQQ80_20910 [Microbacteriaceae bacterium VKM Ac-2855]|nr:hypothetical protein [Microbacteriaceae bacterium VKM Ac-2855]